MFNFNKDYLINLYGLSDELTGLQISFKNTFLENKYQESLKEKELQKSKYFYFISLITFIVSNLMTLQYNNYKLCIPVYIISVNFIFQSILFALSFYVTNFKIFLLFKYLRFIMEQFAKISLYLFPLENFTLDLKVKVIYKTVFYYNLVLLYYLDFNYLTFACIPCFPTISLIYMQIFQDFPQNYLLSEILFNILFGIIIYFFKKSETIEIKKSFFELHKNDVFIEYIKDLLDVLNTKVISFRKNCEIKLMNKFSSNFFDNLINSIVGVTEMIDNQILLKKGQNPTKVQNYIYTNFISCLILNEQFEEFNQGENLKEILDKIFKNEKYSCTKEFNKIDYFNLDNNGIISCNEIHFRKLKFHEEVVELLIYDVSDIKIAEKINAEAKYKQKILAKIAHEFKTPLITIITLINSIVQEQNKIDSLESIQKKLNHIHNLSNYTIVLINDIVQYVSGSNDLMLLKEEINLREVINFSFQVLQTLVECNETKANKIKTQCMLMKRSIL